MRELWGDSIFFRRALDFAITIDLHSLPLDAPCRSLAFPQLRLGRPTRCGSLSQTKRATSKFGVQCSIFDIPFLPSRPIQPAESLKPKKAPSQPGMTLFVHLRELLSPPKMPNLNRLHRSIRQRKRGIFITGAVAKIEAAGFIIHGEFKNSLCDPRAAYFFN